MYHLPGFLTHITGLHSAGHHKFTFVGFDRIHHCILTADQRSYSHSHSCHILDCIALDIHPLAHEHQD